MPPPRLIEEQCHLSTARACMPAEAATISTMASTAPTSWKWIFSMGTLWILASLAPRSSKAWMAVCLTAGARVAGQGGGGLVEDGGIEAGVDEGSEEHVAADAGEAVEVGDAHGVIVSWVAGAEGEVSAPASLRDHGVPGLVRCG